MKNNRICPKCSSSEIIRVEGKTGAYGEGNNIPLGVTVFSYVKVPRYICCSCGYSEEWIDKEDLPKIIKKYRR